MVISYGHHIYTKSYYTAKATMCAYPHSYHALPHWKCVMQFCAKFSSVPLHDQEIDDQYTNTSSLIRFHIYHLIASC